MKAISWIVIGSLLCSSLCVVESSVAESVATQPGIGQAGASTVVTPTVKAEQESVSNRIGRAFMNCLMQIDQNSAQLADNPKVRESEERSARLFCEQRKAECREKADSESCQIFLEDYGEKAL